MLRVTMCLRRAFLIGFVVASGSLWAQEAPPAEPTLPAADSPASRALVDTAITKLQAFGRGQFQTSESRDQAMLRGAPFGGDLLVEGGWHRGLIWGVSEEDRFFRHGGRMVARVGDAWRLRGTKLGSGREAPFTLDPDLLCTALQELPDAARRVERVVGGRIGERRVAVLSMTLIDEVATEFVESGAVPAAGNGYGSLVVVFGGNAGRRDQPAVECSAHLALSVDLDNGDLVRFATKVYAKNNGRVFVRQARVGGGNDNDAEAEADAEPEPEWRQGLPTRKPAQDESVLLYTVDFTRLGLADPPAIDEATRRLLRLR